MNEAEALAEKLIASKGGLTSKTQQQRTKALNASNFPSERWFIKACNSVGVTGYERNLCLLKRFFGDFVFFRDSLKLVVEIDGSSHKGKEIYDNARDILLESSGFVVIRIKHRDEYALRDFFNKWGNVLRKENSRGRRHASFHPRKGRFYKNILRSERREFNEFTKQASETGAAKAWLEEKKKHERKNSQNVV